MQRKSPAVSKTRLLTTQEVSEMFNITPNFIYLDKAMPKYRCGRALRFKEDELLEYFKRKAFVPR